MVTLSFPTNPTLNQTYTFGTKTWVWTGTAWQLQTSGAINNIPIGNTIPSTGAFSNLSGANISGNYVSIVGNILGGNVQGGNVVLTGNTIGGPANLTLTSPNVVFSGNVFVEGNTTFISSNSITTNSLLIQLANNATLGAAANNAGITVGANSNIFASFLYNDTTKDWTTNIGLSVVGNITAAYYIGNGSQLTSLNGANIVGNISTTGNITGGNLATSGQISASGNVIANNISLGNNISVGGNVVAGTNISAIGNISSTNLSVTGNANIGNLKANGAISAVGNVTSNNVVIGNTLNFSNGANVAVYQIYNPSTGSLDTIFN